MASINYAVTNNWGSGFTGSMTVSAGSQAVHGWTVEFDAAFDISNIWGAQIVSHVGNHYVISNADWDANVTAGSSVSFGFQAAPVSGGSTAATGLSVNGAGSTPPPALPTLSVADAIVTEGNSGTSDLAFTVSLSAAATGPVTVAYAAANGTATAGSDYTAQSGTLTFAAGETSKVVHIAVTADTAVEANETLSLTLSAPSGATLARASATGTIVNDDVAPPTLSISDSSFNEGSAASPGHGTFTVTLSAASTSPVTVHFATADGTAAAGSDYVAQSGTLTFAAGETAKTITVNAIGDATVEPNESFAVVLSSPTGATLADATGAGTIVNDDTAAPPLGGGASINYTVTSNWGSGFNGDMKVGGGSAALNGWTVAFDAAFTITNIWNAQIVSHVGNHYVISNLSYNGQVAAGQQADFGFQANIGSSDTQATGFTVNGVAIGSNPPPPPPTLSVADATVTEGNGGTSDLAFIVSLSAAATSPVTVAYGTANGTATAGSDYTAQSGTLTFAAGETSKVVHVAVTGDTAVEANETLSLTLSAPAGATLARANATGTITNDDVAPPPTLAISDASFAEGSAATPGHGTFTVTLSAAAASPVTVKFATADGTAVAGSDYVAQTGTLTFAAGETAKTITVAAIGDAVVEANESFSVVLSNPTGATLADATGLGTLTNDDIAPVVPSLSLADASAIEGTPGALSAGWLSTAGNQIVDSGSHTVQIAGVNWFGFESSTLAPHGLWTRGYKDMMQQMADLGFNTIRLPFSSEMLHTSAAPNGIDFSKNPDLQGLSALQVMDKIVDYAGQLGLKIILDHHRSDSGAGTSGNGLWYDGSHSAADWVSDWQMLATRYAAKPQVIGADLHNEPYNGTWGGGGPNDWAAAAETAGNAIGAVNPNWLVFVEGVGTYQGQSYWWGGNLMGVKDRPIQLTVPNKLVYSPHDYPNSVFPQTWFQGPDFPANLPAKFDQMWGYIYKQGIAPVYVGEFGTNLSDPKDAPWLKAITAYMAGDLDNNGTRDIAAGAKGVSWTFWSWNPNSGDTGGILKDDWSSVNTAKMAYLTPIEYHFDTTGGTPVPANHADFVLTLSQPATTAVTVDFHAVAGEATAADFTGANGSVSFAPGEQSKTISIAITPDALAEGTEHFTVVLSNVQGATIARATATGTIRDDDAAAPPPPPTTPPPPPTPPATNPAAWSASATYNTGTTVTENGVTYRANWWSQGSDPAQNSGYANDGVMWTIVSGTPVPVAWTATGVYTAGLEVTENGVLYKANYWTQGADPAHSNGNGQPWTVVGSVDGSHMVPNAPTDLAATATSSSTTLLNWHAATVPDGTPLTGYAIFENGHQVATTTGTSYLVTGLTPDTAYQFSVTALDAAGASAPTAALAVHTTVAPPAGSQAHEFSPYIDMAMSQDADLVAISHVSGIQNFTLAFVLSSDHGIGWQGTGAIGDDGLVNGSTILQQVQAIQAQGGHITISFGGAAGQEAALTATSAATLQAEYQSVIDRYHVDSIDFDIEGAAVANTASLHLRDQALVGLQAANPNLKVSFTLPVLPTGLDANGMNVLHTAQQDGVKIDVVNIMTMDYGTSVDNNGQMGLNAIQAAQATEAQLHSLGLSARIGITPMIGVNDIVSEVFTRSDAQALLAFAQSDPNVARLSMWSVARDNGGSAGAHFAAPDSSGVAQTPYEFAGIFHHYDVNT